MHKVLNLNIVRCCFLALEFLGRGVIRFFMLGFSSLHRRRVGLWLHDRKESACAPTWRILGIFALEKQLTLSVKLPHGSNKVFQPDLLIIRWEGTMKIWISRIEHYLIGWRSCRIVIPGFIPPSLFLTKKKEEPSTRPTSYSILILYALIWRFSVYSFSFNNKVNQVIYQRYRQFD